jgi:hypothetical protein
MGKSAKHPPSKSSGLVVGGRGGPEDELLQSGQEEVCSRTEVESGRIAHPVKAGGGDEPNGEGESDA